MSARARFLFVVVATAPASCAIRYQARDPRVGVPPQPPLRIEAVTVRDLHSVPGEDKSSDDKWVRPKVTQNGREERGGSDDIERTVLWEIRIQAGARTEIADMTWSAADAPLCAGGHPALDIVVDDVVHNTWVAPDVQVHWERPVIVSGEHVVGGRFDEDPRLLQAPSVVDVRLVHHDGGRATEECVRLAATGPGVGYWNDKRWSLGGRFGLRVSFPFTTEPGLIWAASVGRWVGPIRIGFEMSAGGTDALTFGGALLETSGIAWRGRRWALGWSLGGEAIYGRVTETPMGAGTAVKRDGASIGPRFGLAVLRVVPDVAGVSRVSPTSGWGFELFVAAGKTVKGEAAGDAVSGGVALLGF